MTAPLAQRPIRLLLVDDDEELLAMLVMLLTELSYDIVATAANGAEAVAAADRVRPDLVLMDLRMPVMSGMEAAEALRTSQPGLPVILLSAYDDAGLQAAARAVGVADFLVKGCSGLSIAAAIDAALAK